MDRRRVADFLSLFGFLLVKIEWLLLSFLRALPIQKAEVNLYYLSETFNWFIMFYEKILELFCCKSIFLRHFW
jgi:hypothetical protein